MYPEILRIGPFALHSYGLLVSLAFLTGLFVASHLARRAGLNSDHIMSLGIYVAAAAIIGAKLFLILSDLGYYIDNPGQIFSMATLQAGGVFFGGMIAALLTAAWYIRRDHLPALKTCDVFAPGLALGHAIGRVGCFLAGCCWGRATNLPWAVTFTNPVARELVGVPLGVPLHPTQLYESIAEFLIFGVLWLRFLRPHREGSIIGLYLLLYPAFRFVVEFVRAPADLSYPFGALSLTQWVALVLVAGGGYLLARPRRAAHTAG